MVNVLLGGGRRLFDQLRRQFELELTTGVTETHGVTHLEYYVRREALHDG
jgi:alkaline phosphatase